MLNQLLEVKKNSRTLFFPLFTSIAVGTPLLYGIFFNQTEYMFSALLGGTIFFNMPHNISFKEHNLKLFVSTFLYLIIFTTCFFINRSKTLTPFILFSFSLISFLTSYKLNLKGPGSFFFIFVAILSLNMPQSANYNLMFLLAFYAGLGFGIFLSFLFFILFNRNFYNKEEMIFTGLDNNNLKRFVIFSLIITLSYFISIKINMSNSYWLTITVVALLQEICSKNIILKAGQRLIGTLIGFLIIFIIYTLKLNMLYMICLFIIFQFLIEASIIKNYGIAIIFVTPLTIILASFTNPGVSLLQLFKFRVFSVLIGVLIVVASIFIKKYVFKIIRS